MSDKTGDQLTMRIGTESKDALRRLAIQNHRSMSAQVRAMIEMAEAGDSEAA